MATVTSSLQHPPIIEAVLDIDCDLAPGFALPQIETAARDALEASYPRVSRQLLREFKFGTGADGATTARQPSDATVQALQFRHDDGRQVIQFRSSGYSFNRLAPYTALDDYVPEIHKTWEIYRRLAKPLQISSMQLRYINRIRLPLVGGNVDLDEFFTIGPRLPATKELTFSGFFQQVQAIEPASDLLTNVVLASQETTPDVLPIVLDISVAKRTKLDADDLDSINATLQALRELKNRVFDNALTKKCMDLFQ